MERTEERSKDQRSMEATSLKPCFSESWKLEIEEGIEESVAA